jgi:hypothetical protein
LLDVIAGLTKPDTGRVLADDQPIEGPGRHRLVMFQESRCSRGSMCSAMSCSAWRASQA